MSSAIPQRRINRSNKFEPVLRKMRTRSAVNFKSSSKISKKVPLVLIEIIVDSLMKPCNDKNIILSSTVESKKSDTSVKPNNLMTYFFQMTVAIPLKPFIQIYFSTLLSWLNKTRFLLNFNNKTSSPDQIFIISTPSYTSFILKSKNSFSNSDISYSQVVYFKMTVSIFRFRIF